MPALRTRFRRLSVPPVLLLSIAVVPSACVPATNAASSHDHEHEPVGELSQALVSYDCGTRADTGYSNVRSGACCQWE